MDAGVDYVFDPAALAALAKARAAEYAAADPFPHAVFDGFLRPEAADALAREFPRPEDPVGWDHYGYEGFEKKIATSKEQLLPPLVRRTLQELNTAPFIDFLEALTGIEGLIPDPKMLGGGIHLSRPGDLLGIHADFNWHPALKLHRRINLLVYLNPGWDTAWGSDLELWDTTASRCVRRIAPLMNRAVVFNTRSDTFHGHPRPLACPDGVYRRSIAAYYYTAERPADEIRDPHNTRYKGLHLD
jgi:Rps23 Pro-64 3,4-dihydroxylase Tpa1-like proline 4-hydroxylase